GIQGTRVSHPAPAQGPAGKGHHVVGRHAGRLENHHGALAGVPYRHAVTASPADSSRNRRLASITCSTATFRGPGWVHPAALGWPPPPKRCANRATSAWDRDRKATRTAPSGCSKKERAISTPARLRG